MGIRSSFAPLSAPVSTGARAIRPALAALALTATAALIPAPQAAAGDAPRVALERLFGYPRLVTPTGIEVDADNNVYVTDFNLHQVFKYDPHGNFLDRWGAPGSGDGELGNPLGVAISPAGHVYVSEPGNHRVQKFDTEGRLLGKWGAPGSGDGQFSEPGYLDVGPDESVWVADTDNGRLQQFDADGRHLSTLSWEGGPRPSGVAVTGHNFVVTTDVANHRVEIFRDGVHRYSFGGHGDGELRFDRPLDVAVGAPLPGRPLSRFLYVSDYHNDRVSVWGMTGDAVALWEDVPKPGGVAYNEGYGVYVTGPFGTGRVERRDADGNLLERWGGPGEDGNLGAPGAVAVDGGGNVLVPDAGDHRVVVFAADGKFKDAWGGRGSDPGRFEAPRGVAIAPDDTVYVADTGNDRIQRFDSAGNHLGSWGARGEGPGELNSPRGLAVDAQGTVYVADAGNRRVQLFGAEGDHLGSWGGFARPDGVAVDPERGLVYVLDAGARSVQARDPQGALVAGWGEPGRERDRFSVPAGIATDVHGAVYVADQDHAEVKKFWLAPPATRIDSTPGEPTSDPTPTFTFSSEAVDAEFECSIVPRGHSARFAPCSGPGNAHTPAAPLADGRYTFSVRAIDGRGARDPEPATHDFRVAAAACKRATAERARAKQRIAKAKSRLRAARKQARELKRKDAAARRVKRAKRKVTRASKRLRRARTQLRRATAKRGRTCGRR